MREVMADLMDLVCQGSRQLNFLSIISSCMALQDREFQANGRKSKDLQRGVRMWKAIVAGGKLLDKNRQLARPRFMRSDSAQWINRGSSWSFFCWSFFSCRRSSLYAIVPQWR